MIEYIFETNDQQLNDLRAQTSIYLAFQDYIRHFLSLLGYNGLNYQNKLNGTEELSFWDKKKILYQLMQKEICRLSGKKNIDDFSISDPIIKWAYSYMIGVFSFIWSKEFNLDISYSSVQKNFIFENPIENLSSDSELGELFYKIIEPHIISHKSLLVKRNTSNRHVCEYCGTRYDFNNLHNCPSCGA